MSMQELRMLVAAAQENTALRIQAEMQSLPFGISWAGSACEAKRMLNAQNFSGLMVFLPLPGDGVKLMTEAAQMAIGSLFLMAREDAISEEEKERLGRAGVMILPKPLNRERFLWAMETAACMHSRMVFLQETQKKIQELRSVERAKMLLMKTLGMTEPQAHRFIEKQAMDARQSKAEVAARILRTYENI